MKKLLLFILFIIIVIFSYFYFNYEKKDELMEILIKTEDKEFQINDYGIFGTHFNISGCIDTVLSENSVLILKNQDEEIELKGNFKFLDNKTCFDTGENNNDSIYLDSLKNGKYLLLIKDYDKYYSLTNKTEYSNLEYYTITQKNKNNKIDILFKTNEKDYVIFNIKEASLPDNTYDIALDPGHGGKDTGSSGVLNNTTYYESNLTLEVCLKLKKELEKLGLKVKLTRDDDVYLSSYDRGGRALIPNDYNTKYSLSIHFNNLDVKTGYGGVEVYTPNNVNIELAKILADNIATIVGYSKKQYDRLDNGVYYTYFTKSIISSSAKGLEKEGMKPYDIKLGAPYMYMIREVGGKYTYAYVDGRNEYYGLNSYYNSNKVAEPYLIELAYLNYNSDLIKAVENPKEFSLAIKKAIEEYLNIS